MKRFWLGLVGTASLAALLGCEREAAGPEAPPTKPPPASTAAVIDFPAEVQADDPAVNDFVREAIGTCVSGDYERFRLLWHVREDPFPRGEFERGWKAVKLVRVLTVQKMRLPPEGTPYEGKYLYYVHGRVELDPSVPEPVREVLLLVVKESEQWRLARAPGHLRRQVLGDKDEAKPLAPPLTTETSRSPESARPGGGRG